MLRQRDELDRAIREQWERRVAVLFTDIKGSTEYFERFGDVAGRAMVQRHNDLLFPMIEEHGGKVVKTIGDAIMAFFETSNAAVEAASAMQQLLAHANHGAPDRDQIHIRIGIHAGEALVDDSDVYGDTVNTAARIEAQADADQILVSQAVLAELSPRPRMRPRGKVKLKGKEQSVALHEVRWRRDARRKALLGKPKRRTLVAAGLVLAIAGLGSTALLPNVRAQISSRVHALLPSGHHDSRAAEAHRPDSTAEPHREAAAEARRVEASTAHPATTPPPSPTRSSDTTPEATRASERPAHESAPSTRPQSTESHEATHRTKTPAEARAEAAARAAAERRAKSTVSIVRLHLEHATQFVLDGKAHHYTGPLVLRLVSGKHSLSFHGAGFIGRSVKLSLRPGEDRTLRIALAPVPHTHRRK